MKKIIVSEMVTLDGFFEGPDREIDWHNVDQEFNDYAIDLLDNVDILLFGRLTYQLMASYWPSTEAITNDPVVAGKMNSLPKIVFSKTLSAADWQNTRIINDDIAGQVRNLKLQNGKDIALFGSANLLSTLIRLDLVDEYRIVVNPVALGAGRRLFGDYRGKVDLALLKAVQFKSGNVALYYRPRRS